MSQKRSTKPKPTIDPELERQLAAASADIPVQAVFTLTTPPGESYRSNDSTKETVNQIVDAAASACHSKPDRIKVFPNAQSFAISGSAELVRSLLKQDEIASAMANAQQEDLMIQPVPSKTSKKKATPRPRKKGTP